METGNWETGPTPASSSAGREWNDPWLPLPRSNFWSVLNKLYGTFINFFNQQ